MGSHMILKRQWQRTVTPSDVELAFVVHHVLRQYGVQCPGQLVVCSWDTSEG